MGGNTAGALAHPTAPGVSPELQGGGGMRASQRHGHHWNSPLPSPGAPSLPGPCGTKLLLCSTGEVIQVRPAEVRPDLSSHLHPRRGPRAPGVPAVSNEKALVSLGSPPLPVHRDPQTRPAL